MRIEPRAGDLYQAHARARPDRYIRVARVAQPAGYYPYVYAQECSRAGRPYPEPRGRPFVIQLTIDPRTDTWHLPRWYRAVVPIKRKEKRKP